MEYLFCNLLGDEHLLSRIGGYSSPNMDLQVYKGSMPLQLIGSCSADGAQVNKFRKRKHPVSSRVQSPHKNSEAYAEE